MKTKNIFSLEDLLVAALLAISLGFGGWAVTSQGIPTGSSALIVTSAVERPDVDAPSSACDVPQRLVAATQAHSPRS